MKESDVYRIALEVIGEVDMWTDIGSVAEENAIDRRTMVMGYVDGITTLADELVKYMRGEDKVNCDQLTYLPKGADDE